MLDADNVTHGGSPFLPVCQLAGRFQLSSCNRSVLSLIVLAVLIDMLVTASIIGGNSGGVVVNTRGEAVSLVSYGYGIYTQTVPIDRAQAVAAAIERRVVR